MYKRQVPAGIGSGKAVIGSRWSAMNCSASGVRCHPSSTVKKATLSVVGTAPAATAGAGVGPSTRTSFTENGPCWYQPCTYSRMLRAFGPVVKRVVSRCQPPWVLSVQAGATSLPVPVAPRWTKLPRTQAEAV